MFGVVFFIWRKRHIAIFADVWVSLWMNFPVEATVKPKNKEALAMIKKKVLDPERIRRIDGGFSFIPHRFLADGFLASLSQKELLLYLFLILASDRNGLSFYSYDAICTLLQLSLEQYVEARNSLVGKDLIAFDGTVFQVLALPQKPQANSSTTPVIGSRQHEGAASAGEIIGRFFKAG